MRILILSYLFFGLGLTAAYFLRRRPALSAVITLSLGLAVIMKAPSFGIKGPAVVIASLWLGFLTVVSLKELFDLYVAHIIKLLKNRKEMLEGLTKVNAELIRKKKDADDKAFTLGQIYDATKKMSGLLKTEEIVGEFRAFINEKFLFSECHIVMLENETESDEIRSGFTIIKGSPGIRECRPDKMDNWKKRLVFYAKSRDFKPRLLAGDPVLDGLELDGKVSRLDVLPLSVENRLVAVISVLDLAEGDRDSFSALASQLAMELKKASLYENVERLSFTDSLTGIYLRKHFLERGAGEIERSRRLELQCAILMLDIDRFKALNDTYGHMVGDVVLKEVAGMIRQNIREVDFVARYGGEEFTVLLPDTGKEGAEHVAERIRKAIESGTITAYDERLHVTISIGAGVFPDNSEELIDLIGKADKALYMSKKNGRNCVTFFG